MKTTERGCCPSLRGLIVLSDLSSSPAGRQKSHHLSCGRGVEQGKWPCDRPYCPPRVGSSAFLCACPSTGDADLLPCRGPSLRGHARCLHLPLCSVSAFWTAWWSDVDKLMLFNTYLVPKHETKWTHLAGTWGVVTWRSLLVSCLFLIRLTRADLSWSWFKLWEIIWSRTLHTQILFGIKDSKQAFWYNLKRVV